MDSIRASRSFGKLKRLAQGLVLLSSLAVAAQGVAAEGGGKSAKVVEPLTPSQGVTAPLPDPALVDVAGDSPALVFNAPKSVDRAIVYLHGRCGSTDSVRPWAQSVESFGTVVALTGDRRCRDGGHYWSYDVEHLHERIEAALHRVAELRDGRLDTEHVTLIGYSEGAARAEQLPRRHPGRYPWVVLAGAPTRPRPWFLRSARAVVIIGGARDRTDHLRSGLESLLSAGKLAAYMELPAARHGEFGPDGPRVMRNALWWLYDRAPSP